MLRLFLFLTLSVAAFDLAGESAQIDRLLDGNKRFMNGNLLHPNRTQERREKTATGQSPYAVIVTCSDSRVSPEIIFDEGIGDLFVVRLAGNVVDSAAKESIQFAVNALGSSVVLVLGHENCGAVNAVLKKQDQSIPQIASLISPSLRNLKSKNSKNPLEQAIKANAVHVKNKLAQDPGFKKMIESGKLVVYSGYFHLESGEVELLTRTGS